MHFHTLDLQFLGVPHAIASFVFPTPEGAVLIEAGPHSTFEALGQALARIGLKPSDVRHVLLTHIHLDHAGAAWAFAELGATVHVHPFGARHLAQPEKLMASARRIYQDQMDRLWGDMRPIAPERLHETAHGETLRFGGLEFAAWHTPGHAVHHIAWECQGHLFTGDVGGVRINGGLVCPPCPPPDIHVPDWKASIALLRERRPKSLYLTHFGEVKDVGPHLDRLEAQLDAWAAWMRPHWEAGTAPEAITPAFQAYVAETLLAHGVPESDLPAYEAANPSWMSVAGLLRYWRQASEGK